MQPLFSNFRSDDGGGRSMKGETASLTRLEKEIRSCRKCAGILSKYGVVPRPIFRGSAGFLIMRIGQAPGPTEYERYAPFQGDARRSIRSLYQYDFYEI